MKRWHDTGIRTQAIALGLIPALLIFVALLAYFVSQRITEIRTGLDDKGTRVAQQVAAASEYTLLTGDVMPLQPLLRNALDEDIIAIQVLDTGDRPLAHVATGLRQVPGSRFFSAPVLQPILDPGRDTDQAPELRPIGQVLVTVSDQAARQRQQHTVQVAAGIGAAVLLFAAVLAWLIGRRIVRPLEAVTRTVAKLQAGYLGSRVEADADGEIGTLQQGINAMAASIEEQQHTLAATIAELEAARCQAEAASNAKGEFLAVMSHELRTPMNGTLGMLELLKGSHLDGSQKQQVDIAIESTRHLLSVVEDILDFSRIEQGKLELELHYFRLATLLQHCADSFGMACARKGIDLRLEIDPPLRQTAICQDETRLRQIIINLLGNAVKFTSQGSITLQASQLQRDGNHLHLALSVRDTGIGIPPESLGSIFESFQQADRGMARQFGGSGLGLAITRRLCDLMDARITVDSTPGEGSLFRIGMTANCREEAPDPIGTPEDAALAPLQGCVMVVEDNQVNQFVIVNMLKRFGLEVLTANNGMEALVLLRDQLPDLVLMDCQMPGMDGFETTRQIRAMADPLRARVTVVALTANAMTADRQQCLAAGMDDYISKPVSLRRLHQAIAYWLNRSNPPA